MNETNDMCEQLSAYLDGELLPEDALRVQHAVARDTDLADEFERLRATRQLLGQLPRVSAPEGFTERVVSRAERLQLLRTPVGGGAYRSFRWITIAAAAVVLLSVGLAVLIILSSLEDVDPTPTQTPAIADVSRDKSTPAAPDDGNTKGGGRLAAVGKRKLRGQGRGGWNGFSAGPGGTKRLDTLLAGLPKDLGRLKSVSINTDNLADTQEEVERLLVNSGVQAALVPAREGEGLCVHYFVQSTTPAQLTTLRHSLDGIRGRQRVSQAPVRHARFATLALADRKADGLVAKLISPRRGRREAKNEESAKEAYEYGRKVPGPMVALAPKPAPESPARPGGPRKRPATKSPSRPPAGGTVGGDKPSSGETPRVVPAAPKPVLPVAKPKSAPKRSRLTKKHAPDTAARRSGGYLNGGETDKRPGEKGKTAVRRVDAVEPAAPAATTPKPKTAPGAAVAGKDAKTADESEGKRASRTNAKVGATTGRNLTEGAAVGEAIDSAARQAVSRPSTAPATRLPPPPKPRPTIIAGVTRRPKEATAPKKPTTPADPAGKRSSGYHAKVPKTPGDGGGGGGGAGTDPKKGLAAATSQTRPAVGGKKVAMRETRPQTEAKAQHGGQTWAESRRDKDWAAKPGSGRAGGRRGEYQKDDKEGGKDGKHRLENGALSTQPTGRSYVGDRMLVITVNFLPTNTDAAKAGAELQTKPAAEGAARKE